MSRKPLLSALILLVTLAASIPAFAITYGQADGTGHPNVGGLVAPWRDGRKLLVCSGTLISPTVFLTAAHCTAWLESLGISDVWVTFDPEFGPSSTLVRGVMVTNPGYNQAQSDPGDLAVIILASSVTWIAPAALPAAGLFDQMKAAGTLKDLSFTAVGYGVNEPAVGGGQPVWTSYDTRQVATSAFNALNPAWLRLSQNAATRDSGTCFGDSGGPNFLGQSGLLVATTITGDSMCFATNVVYRLDTPSARAFLGNFVPLP